MNHQQVAHVWAQQGKDATGCNMFSEGPTIYSYGRHFPIAKFIKFGVVLFTTEGYSVSTAKHISYTRRALPSFVTVFDVPNVEATTKTSHRANYKAYLKTIETEAIRVSRARLYNDVNTLNAWIEEANNYSKHFKLGYQAMPAVTLEDIKPMVAGSIAKQAKAEKARKRARIKADKQREKARVARLNELKVFLPIWLKNNEIVLPSYKRLNPHELSNINGTSYIRVKNDTEAETNQGAEVPLDHIIKAWPLINRILSSGKEFTPNGRTIKLGHFAIDHITPEGRVSAGCHHFSKEEVLRFAKVLGLNK